MTNKLVHIRRRRSRNTHSTHNKCTTTSTTNKNTKYTNYTNNNNTNSNNTNTTSRRSSTKYTTKRSKQFYLLFYIALLELRSHSNFNYYSSTTIIHVHASSKRKLSSSSSNSSLKKAKGGISRSLLASTSTSTGPFNNKDDLNSGEKEKDFDVMDDLLFGGPQHPQQQHPQHPQQKQQPSHQSKTQSSQEPPIIRHLEKKYHPKNQIPKLSPKQKSIRTIASSLIHDSTNTISKVLRGDVAGHVPADIYGQTLDEEIMDCHLFFQDGGGGGNSNSNRNDGSNGSNGNGRNHRNGSGNNNNKKQNNEGVITDDYKTWTNLHPLEKQTIEETSKYNQIKTNLYNNQDNTNNNNNNNNNNNDESSTLKRKLYGGAQYHRLLQQYDILFKSQPISSSTPDEISLLLHGISDNHHDGSDLLRSVAILSSRRMSILARSILESLAIRMEFVLGRMWDVVEYTLISRTLSVGNGFASINSSGSNNRSRTTYCRSHTRSNTNVMTLDTLDDIEKELLSFIKKKFHMFVKQKVLLAFNMASGDIDALMKFVSWDLAFSNGRIGSDSGGGGGSGSGTSTSAANQKTRIVSSDVDEWDDDIENDDESDDDNNEEVGGDMVGGVLDRGRDISSISTLSNNNNHHAVIDSKTDELLMDIIKAVQRQNNQHSFGMTGTTGTASQSYTQTYAAVNMLVQHVTNRWRLDISKIVSTKFNSFCLVAFHDEIGSFLRKEMDHYLEGLDQLD